MDYTTGHFGASTIGALLGLIATRCATSFVRPSSSSSPSTAWCIEAMMHSGPRTACPRAASTCGGCRSVGAFSSVRICSTRRGSLRRSQRPRRLSRRRRVSSRPVDGVCAAVRTVSAARCFKFGKACRDWDELKQYRPEPTDGLMQGPDGLLMLAGQCLDRSSVLTDGRQQSVRVLVGAQNVRQNRGVIGIRFAVGLAVAFAVAGHRPWVDRIDGEAGLGEGHDEAVLFGFDRDRSVLRASSVLGDQPKWCIESVCAGADSRSCHDVSGVVGEGDVVVCLGPIDSADDTRVVSSLCRRRPCR